MNKLSEKKIEEMLKNTPEYSVSSSKNFQIIRELNRLKNLKLTPSKGDYYISLTNIFMKNLTKFAAVVAGVALVAVVGMSGILNPQTTYASHLQNAEKALQELQLLQNQGDEVNQEKVRELIQEVVSETNAAMELAQKEPAGEAQQKALQEVQRVQEKSMTMLQQYAGEGSASAEDALKLMEQNRERVRTMLGEQAGSMNQEQNQVQEQNKEQVQNSVETHLQNAEMTLNKMQLMQQNGESAASAEADALVEEVVEETGAALNLAQQEPAGEAQQKALQEVQQVQEKTLTMLQQYAGEGNSSAEDALKLMEQDRERVRTMLGEQSGSLNQEMTQTQTQTQNQTQVMSGENADGTVQAEEPVQVQAGETVQVPMQNAAATGR